MSFICAEMSILLYENWQGFVIFVFDTQNEYSHVKHRMLYPFHEW